MNAINPGDLRVLLLSDLHLEMHDYTPVKEGYDVVVLAGDIHTKGRGVPWALEHFTCPTVYVLGNHEGYGGHWEKTLEKMRRACEGTNVHLLHRDQVIIEGVRFLGITGWASFELWKDRAEAMFEAGRGRDPYSNGAKDYRFIRTGGYRRITPADTVTWNLRDRQWLENALAETHEGPTVVVSHHAPSAQSLEHGVTCALDATDANAWDDLVRTSGAALWLHGHTHHPVDYWIGSTRLGSNPRGYPGQQLAHRRDGVWTVPRPTLIHQPSSKVIVP